MFATILVRRHNMIPDRSGIKFSPSVTDTTEDDSNPEGRKMAEAKISSGRSGAVEVAAGAGLSATFLLLAIVVSPLAAAVIVIPLSLAAGLWRAHTEPRRTPHSLSVPVFTSSVVIHAAKVTGTGGDHGVTTAA